MSAEPGGNHSYRELQKLSRQFDRQLQDIHLHSPGPSDAGRRGRWIFRILIWPLFILAMIVAPFAVLVRSAVYFYSEYQLHSWIALAGGVLVTMALLLGYVIMARLWFGKGWGVNRYLRRGIAILVLVYSLYGLLYYSGMNTKTGEVQSYYRSMHPIMRLALTSVTFADQDIVVTDIQRSRSDYNRMGLSEKEHSLHYVQRDGYVHAVDIRTKGRPEWVNALVYAGMEIMGLESVRHVGTADHLHIYLPLND